MLQRIFLWSVVVSLLWMPGCSKKDDGQQAGSGGGGSGSAAAGYDTPQAAFDAFQGALKQNDWKTAALCMTPESQEQMAGGLAIVASLVAAFEPQKGEEIKALLKKHGVDPDSSGPQVGAENPFKELTAPITDKPAFIAELMTWMEKNSDESGGGGPDFSELDNMKLDAVEINGDSATAKVIGADGTAEEQPIEFRKINGKWFVNLPQEGMEDGPSFDTPGGDQFGGPFLNMEEEQPDIPLESVTQEQFTAAWQTNMGVDQQPALQALAQLVTELGLSFEPPAELEVALSKPVTLEAKPRTRLQAIEEICEQIGVYPQYGAAMIELTAGTRPYPAAFAGPFVIMVDSVQERPPYATGDVQIHIFAAGLPPHLTQYLVEATDMESVTFQRATDAAGNDLLDNEYSGGILQPQMPGGNYHHALNVALKNLLRGVERVQNLEGTIQYMLPTQVAVLEFDKLAAGESKTSGDIKLTLEQVEEGSVSVAFEGSDMNLIRLVAYDQDGQAMDAFSTGGFGGGGSGTIASHFEKQPARLEARIITMTEPLHFSFTLSAIPLQQFANMPEKIEALEFSGEAPVTLEFVRFSQDENFPEAFFKAKNSSNKDVERLELELEYLDGEGKVMETFPHTHEDGGILVKSQQESELSMAAFFRPEGATSARAVLKVVRFADAAQWQNQTAEEN